MKRKLKKIGGILLSAMMIKFATAQGVVNYYDIIKNYGEVETYFPVERLWDIDIYSQITDGSYYFATLKLMDKAGDVKYKSKTQTFQINENYFSVYRRNKDVSPFESEWIDNYFYTKVKSSGGFLLPGTYKVEYTLLKTTAGCNWAGEVLIKRIFELTIEYFNNIELVYPANGDTLNNLFPNFLWLPLAPYRDGIKYTIRVVESTQSPEQDLYLNMEYLMVKNLSTTNLIYPSSARKLDYDKRYVWQVVATNENSEILAVSSPNVFYIKGNNKSKVIELHPSFSYIELNENVKDQWFELNSDTLFIAIRHFGNVEKPVIKVVNLETKKEIKVSKIADRIQLKNGLNLFVLNLSELSDGVYDFKIQGTGFPEQHFYLNKKQKK
ncbi:MAG TPA: hypothetical protein PK995_08025 [Bacteroidia bacterium]|nr:hypothetical protein [Bacteroidia bacterium]